MGMEPFDYLTYKKNKQKPQKKVKVLTGLDKKTVMTICTGTFAVFFIFMMIFVASKSSKIDIEYGRLGEKTNNPVIIEVEDDDEEISTSKPEKFTIDKRLFLIQQEEKGPSISKVVEKRAEQSEVISNESFKEIKNNSLEVIQKAESQKNKALEENEELPKKIEAPVYSSQKTETKPVIKPKITPPQPQQQTRPVAKPAGALEAQGTARVLVGKYSTVEEARKTELKMAESGVIPFVKNMGSYYTLQVGAFDNFETAKAVAARLQAKGFDVWIYQ